MKNLILTVLLFSNISINAQSNVENQKTAKVTSTVTKEYQPEFYEVSVTIKEYENINPEDQKVVRINIGDIEKSVFKKLEESGVKISTIIIDNIIETTPIQNNYGYMNTNYTSTQKRELSKTLNFQVKNNTELENIFLAMRINGVQNVYATPTFTDEKQLEIEKELIKMAIEKARIKANTLETLIGKKLGEVQSISEAGDKQDAQVIYNYNYNNNFLNQTSSLKSMTLIVNYSIE